MAVVSISYLLEAGVHFGHQTKRWNPKMKEYIFTSRDDIYIIDLEKTAQKIEEAYLGLKEIAAQEGKVLFVGTKKQAQEAVKDEALRSDMFYINERWLGGTLTNFKTIRLRINRLTEIEEMEQNGKLSLLPKKEQIQIRKEYDKLIKNLGGIREMKKLPQAIIVVDPTEENTVIKEARKLRIPIFGIVDTNCDPDQVDFPIPGNDDAIRSVKLILSILNNAICEANNLPIIDYIAEEDKNKTTEEKPKKVIKEEIKEDLVEEIKEDLVEEVKEEKPKKVIKEEVKEEKPKKTTKPKQKKEESKVDVSTLTVAELKELAKEKDIKNYSKMKKDELIEALK